MSAVHNAQTKLIAAMKEGNAPRRDALRMLIAALKNASIEERAELIEEKEVEVISREAKRLRESIEEFKKAGRADLVLKYTLDLAVIEEFLPVQASDEDILSKTKEILASLGTTEIKDLGRTMGALMKEFKGKADGNRVRAIAESLLK